MKNFTLGLAAALSLAIGAPAAAATINEGSFAGGDFSGSATAPSVIANGFDTVTGSLGGSDNDILAFTGMTPGAQQVTLNFAAPGGIGWSYISGGSILYSTQPFQWNWDGTFAGSFFTSLWQPNTSVTINLGAGFAGSLYLALYSWGDTSGYSISVPGNVPAAVPLPASVLLLGGAVAALGARRRKSNSAAA